MTADPGTGETRIVAGVDGSRPSQEALRWAAHFAAIFGAQLEAVTAWEYPPTYGWAAIAPEWDPAQDMRKVLNDTICAVFEAQPPQACSCKCAKGVPPRYCSMPARVRSCWSSAAEATEGSPGCCSGRSPLTSPSTLHVPCSSSTEASCHPYDPSASAAPPRAHATWSTAQAGRLSGRGQSAPVHSESLRTLGSDATSTAADGLMTDPAISRAGIAVSLRLSAGSEPHDG